MIEHSFQLPLGIGMFQDGGIFDAPDGADLTRIILRWAHFVAGITWIGILYFFNLVNVNFMKALDGPTKKVVVPELMPSLMPNRRKVPLPPDMMLDQLSAIEW